MQMISNGFDSDISMMAINSMSERHSICLEGVVLEMAINIPPP